MEGLAGSSRKSSDEKIADFLMAFLLLVPLHLPHGCDKVEKTDKDEPEEERKAMKKEYILFDLDGTLTDPEEGITRSVQYALNHYGIQERDRKKLIPFIGPPLRESFMKFYGFSWEQAGEAVWVYREYFARQGIFENRVYDGVPEMLEGLKTAGVRILMATSKPEKYAKQIAEHFGFDKYFDFIGGACMDGRRTDKYEVIEYVLKSCAVARETAVMIGDRSHDVAGAKKAGFNSIGVLYGYGCKEELEKAGAGELAALPSDVVKIVLGKEICRKGDVTF